MLNPMDIDRKVFKRQLRGYAVDDVEDFLQQITESFEQLYRENVEAKETIAALNEKVQQYKAMEDAMQTPGIHTQNTERIEQEQNTEIISHSVQEVAEISYQYEQMKRSVEVFRAKVVSLLNAQLDIIKEYSNIQVDDVTVQEAKAVFEKTVGELAGKTVSQDTEEIPENIQEELNGYISNDEK